MDTLTPDVAPLDTPAPVSDESSLSDHEAQFSGGPRPSESLDAPLSDLEDRDAPDEDRTDRDDKGRFRHRASSQRATAEDVAQINALTKELRTKEAELAKAKPDALSGSPRIRALQRQIKAIEADLASSAPETKPAPVETRRPEPLQPAVAETARPKPTEDEIGSKYATYGDYVEDLADWKVEQREAKRDAELRKAREQAQYSDLITTHDRRMQTFAASTPDFATVTAPLMTRALPNALIAAIVQDDNGPKYVYHLAQHPDVADELVLLTHDRPVTDDFVATVQRRLAKFDTAHAQAATTGSAAVARQTYIPPRPPNPVRTGPIRTGDDLPGDESSLAEHERAFSRRR